MSRERSQSLEDCKGEFLIPIFASGSGERKLEDEKRKKKTGKKPGTLSLLEHNS